MRAWAQTGRLSDDAIERTIAALKICAQRIAHHRVRHVRAVATQAARLAANTDILVARARAEAGIALDVISAEQEADLASLGCAPLIGGKYRGALIFDIGGGSTEIVWQHKGKSGHRVGSESRSDFAGSSRKPIEATGSRRACAICASSHVRTSLLIRRSRASILSAAGTSSFTCRPRCRNGWCRCFISR